MRLKSSRLDCSLETMDDELHSGLRAPSSFIIASTEISHYSKILWSASKPHRVGSDSNVYLSFIIHGSNALSTSCDAPVTRFWALHIREATDDSFIGLWW